MRPAAHAVSRPRALLAALGVACLVFAAGCGARTGLLSPDDAAVSPADTTLDAPTPLPDAPVDVGVDGPPRVDFFIDRTPSYWCTPGTSLIHVIDSEDRLYTFDPEAKTVATAYKRRGTLSCPLPGGPFSMAVRRDSTAYVLYTYRSGGCSGLARVDLETLRCARVPGFSCASVGSQAFGMGFMGTANGDEKLYIGSSQQFSLWTLDPDTGAVARIGAMPQSGPEFAGNSDGELWGFFARDSPVRIIRLDPNTAKAITSITVTGLTNAPASYAFSMWKGVFYIFYGTGSTAVYRVTRAGAFRQHLPTSGFRIVGAGVSTCKPRN